MTPSADDERPGSAEETLARLMEGNVRFVTGERRFARESVEALSELASGQHPFATILGCSDSRVPPRHTSTLPFFGANLRTALKPSGPEILSLGPFVSKPPHFADLVRFS